MVNDRHLKQRAVRRVCIQRVAYLSSPMVKEYEAMMAVAHRYIAWVAASLGGRRAAVRGQLFRKGPTAAAYRWATCSLH